VYFDRDNGLEPIHPIDGDGLQMSKEPVFSFVIPVYQKPAEIFERCLASLFDQTLKEIEVIAIFDGPDKELQEVASKFPKVQSHVIEHGGAPKARNYGTSLAKGKYVVCWDADCQGKPEMATRWLQEFEATGADFVYSGYEFSQERGGYPSEQFDPYSLTCGNYISTMFPILREKAPKWDESLKCGQDWDFWLTAVENGCKGVWIEGSGWITEPSFGSISDIGWSPERRAETIRIVKEKHGIPEREIAVGSFRHFFKALHIAKLTQGDILKNRGEDLSKYKMIFNLGMGDYVRFRGASKDCVKIHYWMPWDIDCMYAIAFKTARETIAHINTEVTHNFCNEITSKKRLEDLGIKAEVLPLPTEIDGLEETLPDKFKVLVDCDKAYRPILVDLPKALPHIPIDFVDTMGNVASIPEYSLLLSFYENPGVDESMRRFLLHGRNLISNVQAPFCGYVDMGLKHVDFKNEMINRIMDARDLGFNKKAQDYYKNLVDPKKFVEKLNSLLPQPAMEVVS